MKEVNVQKIRVKQHSIGGLIWFAGWLFTIGFLNLSFGKGALALLIWPAYVGYALSPLLTTLTRLSSP